MSVSGQKKRLPKAGGESRPGKEGKGPEVRAEVSTRCRDGCLLWRGTLSLAKEAEANPSLASTRPEPSRSPTGEIASLRRDSQ